MPPKNHCKKLRYKKAPEAPIRFKSAYIFFSIAKQKEIRAAATEKLVTTTIAKMVAEAWKAISPEQKSVWEEMATQDRERFEREKKNYTGPWKVLASKHPSAPKRPMSAYLDFSNSRRAKLGQRYPKANNGQISKMLAKMWKEAPVEMKSKYIAREAMLREKYKKDLAAWKEANHGGILLKPTLLEETVDMEHQEEDETEELDLEPRETAHYAPYDDDDDDDDRKPPAIDKSVNEQFNNVAARMIYGHTGGQEASGVSRGGHAMRMFCSDMPRTRSSGHEDANYNLTRLSSSVDNNYYATASSTSQPNFLTLMGGGGSYISSTSSSANEVTGLAPLLSTNNDYATTTTTTMSSNHPNFMSRLGGGGGNDRVSFISSTSFSAGGGEIKEGLEPLISTDVGGFLAAAAALDLAALQDPSTRDNDISARVQGVVAKLPSEMITNTSTDEPMLLKYSSSSSEKNQSDG